MALSDNAIGFFLEAEDVSLTRTLASATTSYERYTKALEKYNERAFQSTQKGLGKVTDLLKAAEKLPDRVAKGMARASATIEKGLKPVTQSVEIVFTVGSSQKLKAAVGRAVSEAMSGANVRLSASMPQKRMALFDSSVSLRTQYANVTQPPDMRGKIQPLKKFREGGVVEGPNKAMDSVLALLQPGELVLPVDVTKQLKSLGGQLLKTGGLDKGKLKDLVALTELYGDELADVNKALGTVHDNLDNLADVTKQRLGSAMLNATKRVEALEEETTGAGTALKKLLVDILGPARFLAIRGAIADLQEGLGGLRSGFGSAFTTLGGDEITSGIEAINQMNQFLGVSRARLREIKTRAGDMAKEVEGITFDELGRGLLQAAEHGIRDEETLFRLAKAGTLAAKGMNIAQESAISLGFELTSSLNLSQEGFEATLGTLGRLSDKTSGFNISAGKLFEQTTADVAALNTTLRQMSDEESQRLIGSFNQIGAVLESQFIDQAGDIRQTLARALEGGPENVDAMRKAQLLTGKSVEQLRAQLEKGDIAGIFDSIGEQARGMDTQQLNALADTVGLSAENLSKLSQGLGAINTNFDKANTRIAATGTGLGLLEARARANRTQFEKLQEDVTDNAAAFQMFGISGVEVLDFFKEFNATSLLSLAFLSGPLFKGLTTAAGGFKAFALGAGQTAVSLSTVKSFAVGLGPKLLSIAKIAGPLALIAGAGVGFVKFADKLEEIEEGSLKATEEAQKFLHMDPARLKKNIERVQAQIDIDEAAGKVANPVAVAKLESYNQQLANLEAHLKETYGRKTTGTSVDALDPMAQLAAAQGQLGAQMAENMRSPTEIPAVSPEEIRALIEGDFQMATGGTEERLDKNNQLMEQVVELLKEQVRRSGATAPGPVASATRTPQGPSLGLSPFGQQVAGGEL
jgi:hypothetical protein